MSWRKSYWMSHFAHLFILGLGWIFFGVGTVGAAAASTNGVNRGENLSANGESMLNSYLASAELPALQHPDFHDYQQEVREFYDAFGANLPWLADGQPSAQARALIRIFQNAQDEGLDPADYDCLGLEGDLAQIDFGRAPEVVFIQFDLALTISTMRYVSDLHLGRVNPRLFHYDLDIDNRKIDLSEFLRQKLVHAEDIDGVMRTVEPPFPAYKRTIVALKTYRGLARQDSGAPLPVPRTAVKPGTPYSAIPQLKQRLRILGDLPPQQDVTETPSVYEGALVEAVKRFQQRHGLEADGTIGKRTFNELNVPLEKRVEQLSLTLERWRWLPHEFEHPPIVVNIPEFRLHVDDEQYHWVSSMKVVVGSAYHHHQTPVFSGLMRSVIFRPYWNVPLSIQRAELVPEIKRHASYLADHNYEVVNRAGQVVSGGSVNEEMARQLQSGELAIRQRPGPNNALGLLKFEFPNVYDVYLHGTPATELFERSRRDFSHGCIRVEDPVSLAEWILRDQPQWNRDHIVAAMNGDQTVRVNLRVPIPVLIVYGTAVVMEDGEVRFFDDIYGYDSELERVLARGYPYANVDGQGIRAN